MGGPRFRALDAHQAARSNREPTTSPVDEALRWLARVSPRRLPLGDHHPLVLDVDLEPDVASAI